MHRWPGDFNRDGAVDSSDWNELKANSNAQIGDAGYEPDLDLDRDGTLDSDDIAQHNTWAGRTALTPGQLSDPNGPDSRVGYAGYIFNPKALIYTVRHRHYEPMLGRFMEADPAGYIDGMNRYQYVCGAAMNFTDPFGLATDRGGRDLTQMQDDLNPTYCQGLLKDRGKDKYACNPGRFETEWTNHHCGDLGYSVATEVSDAYWSGFGQGVDDALILAADHIVFGQVDDLRTLADGIRVENEGVWGYATGDFLLNRSMKSLELAAAVGTWTLAGGSTMSIGITRTSSGIPHVIWGVTEAGETTFFHSMGQFMFQQVLSRAAPAAGRYLFISEIPVLFPTAAGAGMVGGTGWYCFTTAGHALIRGWFPFL